VAGYTLHNILVNTVNSVDLFIKPFEAMGLDRQTIEPTSNPLFGFGGKKIEAISKKSILVSFAQHEKVCTGMITFDIVNINYSYIAIFGRGFFTNEFEVTVK